jgi:hypothetical protein
MPMSTPSLGSHGRLLLISGALVVALGLPAAALADTTGGVPSIQPASARDATIQVTSVTVIAKVIATVSISFTCQPFQSFDWDTGQTIETTVGRIEGGGATIVQAQGRTIDWGQIEIFGGAATCDGSTVNTVSAPVTAAVSPWKVGPAVVGASIYVTDENGSDSDYATTGPVTVRLTSR